MNKLLESTVMRNSFKRCLRLCLGRVLSQDDGLTLDVIEALLTEMIPVGNKANTSVKLKLC